MKLAPLGPTILQERDAILTAAQASSFAPEAAADVADVWAGFALRGMGFSALVNNQGTGANNTVVTDGFDLPNSSVALFGSFWINIADVIPPIIEWPM